MPHSISTTAVANVGRGSGQISGTALSGLDVIESVGCARPHRQKGGGETRGGGRSVTGRGRKRNKEKVDGNARCTPSEGVLLQAAESGEVSALRRRRMCGCRTSWNDRFLLDRGSRRPRIETNPRGLCEVLEGMDEVCAGKTGRERVWTIGLESELAGIKSTKEEQGQSKNGRLLTPRFAQEGVGVRADGAGGQASKPTNTRLSPLCFQKSGR